MKKSWRQMLCWHLLYKDTTKVIHFFPWLNIVKSVWLDCLLSVRSITVLHMLNENLHKCTHTVHIQSVSKEYRKSIVNIFHIRKHADWGQKIKFEETARFSSYIKIAYACCCEIDQNGNCFHQQCLFCLFNKELIFLIIKFESDYVSMLARVTRGNYSSRNCG